MTPKFLTCSVNFCFHTYKHMLVSKNHDIGYPIDTPYPQHLQN